MKIISVLYNNNLLNYIFLISLKKNKYLLIKVVFDLWLLLLYLEVTVELKEN